MQLDAMMDYGPLSPDSETWACPRRMSASDGNDYVVKISDNGSSKSFFNEFVAANIARMVGLPVAEPAVVHVGDKLVGRSPGLQAARVRPGPYFATRHCRGVYAASDLMSFRIPPEMITNLGDVPAFAVFDIFVHNTDRHGGNTLLVPSSSKRSGWHYLLIDHGHCFGGPHWDHGTVSSMPYELEDVPWQTDKVTGPGDFVDSAKSMTDLSPDCIDKARSELPDEWNVTTRDYAALREALSSRRQDLILKAIRSSQGMFASWRKKGLDCWQDGP